MSAKQGPSLEQIKRAKQFFKNTESVRQLAETFAPADLLPELRPYLRDSSLGTSLNHPLVNMPFMAPMLNGRANQAFLAKREALVEADKRGQWSRAIFLHERPWRFHAFLERAHKMKPPGYWRILAELWIDCEQPWPNRKEWLRAWTADMIGREVYAMDYSERMQLYAIRRQKVVTLWRGTQHAQFGRGLSWTTDRKRAEWFARRFDGGGFLWEARVPPARVLAFMTGRGESEAVIDPTRLRIPPPTRILS